MCKDLRLVKTSVEDTFMGCGNMGNRIKCVPRDVGALHSCDQLLKDVNIGFVLAATYEGSDWTRVLCHAPNLLYELRCMNLVQGLGQFFKTCLTE